MKPVVCTVLLTLIFCDVVRPQVVIPDRPACAECSIQAELMAILGAEDGDAALGDISRVAVDAHNQYWVFGTPMLPKVFDAAGIFVRELGVRGEGPGEFQSPYDLWRLPGDSIAIVDGSSGIHVFDAELRHVRSSSRPILGVNSTVILNWPSTVVLNGMNVTQSRVNFSMHLADFSGSSARLVRSFGETGEPLSGSSMRLLHFTLAPSASGGYWAAAQHEYVLTKWSDAHQQEFTLSRRPSWFREPSDMLDGGPDKPPSPLCMGVTEDEAGLLWSFCLAPATDYRDAYPQEFADQLRAGGAGEIRSHVIDQHLLRYTRIEVIDPATRRVVARHAIDRPVISVLPGRRAAVVTFSDSGVPAVRILRFELAGYSR